MEQYYPNRHKERAVGPISTKSVEDGRGNNAFAGLTRRKEMVERVSARFSAVLMQLYPIEDQLGVSCAVSYGNSMCSSYV